MRRAFTLKPAIPAVAILLLAACSGESAGGSQIQSGTVATVSSTAVPETTATQAPVTETTTTAVGSPEADAFKALAPNLPDMGQGVYDFIETADPVRIDQLAASACSAVSAEMNDTELGLAGIAAYNELEDTEKSQVELEDWVVLYGSLIGFFCPENLPDLDFESTLPVDGTDVEQFRAVVTDIDGVSAEAEEFAASLTDERLAELQATACDATNADMTTEDFGRIIVISFGADLTAEEQDGISLTGYSELYGALVGWFCPSNLPL